jgi:hypothetical protein
MVVGAMKRPLAFLMLALLLSAGGVLSAQDQVGPAEPAAPEKAPRRLLFVMEKGGLFSGYSDNEMIILKRSFLTALSDADDAPTPIDYSLKSFPGSVTDRNKVARDAGADCWLVLKVGGLRGGPSLNVVSYDLLYNIQTLNYTASRHEGFSMLDVYRERWDDVVPLVVKKYPPLISHAYSRGPPAAVTFTLRAVPGTTIAGLSPKPISVGSDGTATLQLPSPAPYSLRATASGYIPISRNIYLDGQTELSLRQERSPRLRLDAAFLDGLFPGLSANFSIPSLPFFVRVGFTSFRAGISINQDQVLTSLPLTQFTFLLGMYVSPEDSDTRWYVGVGPLLRTSFPPGGTLVADRLLPFGVQAVAGGEFPFIGKLRSFFELGPTAYYTPLPDLFAASFGTHNGTFPYITFPPLLALELFEVRFGLRWAL